MSPRATTRLVALALLLAGPPVAAAPDAAVRGVAVEGTRFVVTLTDGRHSIHSRESHRGDFQQPFAESEIREKFRELAGVVLLPEGVRRAENAIDGCEKWGSIAELTEPLRRHGRG